MKNLPIKATIFTFAMSSILMMITIIHFGLNWRGFSGAAFACGLLVLSVIDWYTQLLPDKITLPFVLFGLLLNFCGLFCSAEDAVIGAIVGYISLWLFAWIFQQITGKVGMGHGDFKLLAMLGAWLGWHDLPYIIFFASAIGAIIGFVLMIFKKIDQQTLIPFGPFLALTGWIAMMGAF